MMTEEVRREIDGLRSEIRQIGATLRQLREDLAEMERIKTGPKGEIDLEAWEKADGIREEVQVVVAKRGVVQGRLNDLLRPFRAARIVPALRESGGSVKELITEVRAARLAAVPSPLQSQVPEKFSPAQEAIAGRTR